MPKRYEQKPVEPTDILPADLLPDLSDGGVQDTALLTFEGDKDYIVKFAAVNTARAKAAACRLFAYFCCGIIQQSSEAYYGFLNYVRDRK